MIDSSQDTTVYEVDAEHGGLRGAVLALFFIIWVIAFFAISAAMGGSEINLIAVIGGFVLAYGATALIERALKRRWKSGRRVEVQPGSIRLVKRDVLEAEMRADEAVKTILWTFTVTKRSRVPKGTIMLACALEKETQYLTVYTFMPSAQMTALPHKERFKTILTRKAQGAANPLREEVRLAGEQRRLRDAENYRWLNGAEMLPADFVRYLEQVETAFPEWMPIASSPGL